MKEKLALGLGITRVTYSTTSQRPVRKHLHRGNAMSQDRPTGHEIREEAQKVLEHKESADTFRQHLEDFRNSDPAAYGKAMKEAADIGANRSVGNFWTGDGLPKVQVNTDGSIDIDSMEDKNVARVSNHDKQIHVHDSEQGKAQTENQYGLPNGVVDISITEKKDS